MVELEARLPNNQGCQKQASDVSGHAKRTKCAKNPLLHDGEPYGTSSGRTGENLHCTPGQSTVGSSCARANEKSCNENRQVNPCRQTTDGH